MISSVNIRELVLDILMEVNEKDQYSHLVIRDVLNKYQYLEKQERAFLTRLAEGTIEHMLEMDFIINSFSKVKVKKMKPLIRNLLRMSVYQFRYMDSIPDAAVCNEAVKIAKKRGFGQLRGFVNGVLRNIARNLSNLNYPDETLEPEVYLEVTYSIPKWIIKQWIDAYGYEKTKSICESFLSERPITIRTNQTKCTPKELKVRLEEEGVKVTLIKHLSYAFMIEDFDYLQSLESFQDGWFYVQDISSMMVAEIAEPKNGNYIIDVCAAPGGKSSHLAECMHGTGMVEARDLTEYKVSLIEENIERHGLLNMKAVQMDATIYDENSKEKADILICDLPCSGLGVMGKKTDIRYKMTQEKQTELVELQKNILNTVASYVKFGGTLIYSTCTIHKGENENQVEWFLKEHKEFGLVSMQQMFPSEEYHDGFFIAKLVRKI
ncbi:MAG: 16S rRNA (cytosine(967)-C(5))-methyltransferase RsmB [Lachnospiraceae bacterium]|nr:16S rRNA (cytosine(967)-C(5))-methyltransferase RsmB [Lachnospiraceae bacterium]